MNKWLLGALFFTINFLIFLLPRLMTGVISNDGIIFWAVWVNSLFFLFLILPYKASYFFEENKSIFGLSIAKLIDTTNTTNVSSNQANIIDAMKDSVSSIIGGPEKSQLSSDTIVTDTVGILTSLLNK